MKHKGIWASTTVAIVVLLLYVFSPQLLMVQSTLQPSKAIVVLGGESGERVFRAAELFHQGMAPLVLLSGKGDCEKRHSRLELARVPEAAIVVECQSGSTAENAEFASRILREAGAQTAILVTTWWHTRRAINCFKHFAPKIEFLVAPASIDEKAEPAPDQFVAIMIEYLKTAYYAVRHGII